MTPSKAPRGELVLYQTEDGRTRIDCRFEGDRVSVRLINTFDADGNQLTGDKTGDLGAETTTYDYSCW